MIDLLLILKILFAIISMEQSHCEFIPGDKTYLEILSELQNPKNLILDFTNGNERQLDTVDFPRGFHLSKQEYIWRYKITPKQPFEALMYEFQDILSNYCYFLIDIKQPANISFPLAGKKVEELLKMENRTQYKSLTVIFFFPTRPYLLDSLHTSFPIRINSDLEAFNKTLPRLQKLFFKFKEKWNNVKVGYYSKYDDLTPPAINLVDIYILEHYPAKLYAQYLTLSYSQFKLQMKRLILKKVTALDKLKPDCQVFVRFSLFEVIETTINPSTHAEKYRLYYLLLQSAVIWANSGEKVGVMLEGFPEYAGVERWFKNNALASYITPLSVASDKRNIFEENSCLTQAYLHHISTTFDNVVDVHRAEANARTDIRNECHLELESLMESSYCQQNISEMSLCKRPAFLMATLPNILFIRDNASVIVEQPRTYLERIKEKTRRVELGGSPMYGLRDEETYAEEQLLTLKKMIPLATIVCSTFFNKSNMKRHMLNNYNYCNGTWSPSEKFIWDKHINLQIAGEKASLNEINLENINKDMMRYLRIRSLHPDKDFLFKVYLTARFPFQYSKLYCDSTSLFFNENSEIIINFARTFSLDFGLKTAIGRDNSWWHELLTIDELSELAEVNPFFAARNHPRHQLLHGITKDSCINYTNAVFEEGLSMGKYSGVTFYFEKNNKTSEDLQTMFKFLFYRFSLIELYPISKTDLSFLLAGLSAYFQDKAHLESNITHFYLRIDSKITSSKDILTLLQNIINSNITAVHFANWETMDFSNLKNMKHKHKIRIGLSLEDCVSHVLHQFQSLANISEQFLSSSVDYILCNVKQHKTKESSNLNQIEMEKYLDSHLYIEKYFRQLFPNLSSIEIVFRLEHQPFRFGKESFFSEKLKNFTTENFLRFVTDVSQYAVVNAFNFFVSPAFDSENGERYGWWKITDFNDLSNYSVYVEKESEFLGKESWQPQDPSKAVGFASLKTFLIWTAALLTIILLVAGLFVQYWRHGKYSYLTKDQVRFFIEGESELLEAKEENAAVQSLAFPLEFVLQKKKIMLVNMLGKGNFGLVYKGQLDTSESSTIQKATELIEIAVKMPLPGCPKQSFMSLLSELKVLCYLGSHPNVLGFIGAHVKNIGRGEVYIVTEFCQNGNLLDYLQKLESADANLINQYDLAKFCHEICQGMDYLHDRKVVHGDLSARNILLDSNLTCKIADFGLAMKLYEYEQLNKENEDLLPWRWSAYESLKSKEYSTMSDVWSFGVTCWEVYSLGCTPYPCQRFDVEFLAFLGEGNRLDMPKFSTNEIYEEMLKCWNMQPQDRPTFTQLIDFFCTLRGSNYSKVIKTTEAIVAPEINAIELEIKETQL